MIGLAVTSEKRGAAMQTTNDRDVLLVVDVQNDFCPGGALAVPDGDAIVPTVNRLARNFAHVVLTQDWHPAGHSSFASAHPGKSPFDTVGMPYGAQILWPDHCVQGTEGAAFHPELDVPRAELIVRKGFHPAIDSYSAFQENDRKTPTGLAAYLRERGFERVTLCGLATDFCVLYSALDARAAGFTTTVVLDACRGLDADGSLARALEEMQKAGIKLI
jgi:nicotinamidase/pyrazinamidase